MQSVFFLTSRATFIHQSTFKLTRNLVKIVNFKKIRKCVKSFAFIRCLDSLGFIFEFEIQENL